MIDSPEVPPISSSTIICLFKYHKPPIQYFYHFNPLSSSSISEANTSSPFLYSQPLSPIQNHFTSSTLDMHTSSLFAIIGGAVAFTVANPLQRRDGPVPGVATFNDYATQFQQSGTVCGIAAPGKTFFNPLLDKQKLTPPSKPKLLRRSSKRHQRHHGRPLRRYLRGPATERQLQHESMVSPNSPLLLTQTRS